MVVIENQRGLHARAAAKFARAAEAFQAEVDIVRDDTRVSARSIMGLMMLAATCGTRIKVCARGEDAEAAVATLTDLVKRGFDED